MNTEWKYDGETKAKSADRRHMIINEYWKCVKCGYTIVQSYGVGKPVCDCPRCRENEA